MKVKNFAGVLLAATMLLASCSSPGGTSVPSGTNSSSAERKYKDTLNVVMEREPSSLDIVNVSSKPGVVISDLIFGTLVGKNSKGEIIPELATQWTQVDNLTIRFQLRDDVYFHNGAKFTAEDVKFSLDRGSQKGTTTYSVLQHIKSCEIIDEYQVEITLNAPFSPLFNYLASPSIGAMYCKEYVESAGDDKIAREPVGTGPFKLTNWVPGASIAFERHENYWGEQPTYQNLNIKFIAEPTNRTIELETGAADIIYNVLPTDMSRIENDDNLKIEKALSNEFVYFTLNTQDEKLKDIRVREALACALDMQAIVNVAYGADAAIVADSLMSPTIVGYKSLGVIEYNPERAKTLLKEAGYENGIDLEFSTADIKRFIDTIEIAQNMWKEVGINIVSTDISEMANYLDKAARSEVQIGLNAYNPSSGDPDQALTNWSSARKWEMQCNDPIADQYLLDGLSEYDVEKRNEIYSQALDYLWGTHYQIPVAFTYNIYAMGKNVENTEEFAAVYPADLAKIVIYE